MSSLTTLARPYAKAAFELARESDVLSGWSEMLDLAGSITADAHVIRVLNNPEVSSEQALGLIADAGGEVFDARFGDFLNVLAVNHRLAVLPEIARIYNVLRQEAEKRLQVRVLSAAALDDVQAERMKEALSKRFGCEIELDSEIDSGVLGGAVIYAGDQVIDGSLRGRLNKLEQSLAS